MPHDAAGGGAAGEALNAVALSPMFVPLVCFHASPTLNSPSHDPFAPPLRVPTTFRHVVAACLALLCASHVQATTLTHRRRTNTGESSFWLRTRYTLDPSLILRTGLCKENDTAREGTSTDCAA